MSDARLLRVADVADRIGLSEETVIAAIRSGSLPASNVGQGAHRPRWRVSEADLAQWLNDRKVSPVRRTARRRTLEIPKYV